MFQVGLIEKWLSNVIQNYRKLQKKEESQTKALMSLSKMIGAIVALGIGYTLSFLTLVVELVHWHYFIIRKVGYDKYGRC